MNGDTASKVNMLSVAGGSRIIPYFFVATVAVIYYIIFVNPVFQFFFVQDDLVMLDLGAILKRSPAAAVTFSYCGWWRPIGFGGAAFLYQLFGINPFPYHVAGFLIHGMTAFLVLLLARKLFDLPTGLLAFVFYITSTLGVSSVGFVSNSWQDELGAAFVILALLASLRLTGSAGKRRGPYLAATVLLFLSAACKESWFAYLPVACYVDFVNYRRDAFLKRLIRLSPLLLVFSMFYFRFLYGGALAWEGPLNYFVRNAGFDNLLWGATLPFMPFGVPYDKMQSGGMGDWIRVAAPVGLFAMAWLLAKTQRVGIILLMVTFLSFLLVLSGALLNNGFWGWYHLPMLVAMAAILMAFLLQTFLNRFPFAWAGLLVLLALAGYKALEYPMTMDNINGNREMAREVQVYIRSFMAASRDIPPGSLLVAFDGPVNGLTMDALIPVGVSYMSIVDKNAGRNMSEFLVSSMDYVRREVGSRRLAPTTYYLGHVDGRFKDYTEQVKHKLDAEMSVE